MARFTETREPFVITQNGEAKAEPKDAASLEETQETLAVLKILALGNQEAAAEKLKPMAGLVLVVGGWPEAPAALVPAGSCAGAAAFAPR